MRMAARAARAPRAALRDAAGGPTAAHQTDRCAELVCSNSFRSDNPLNAVGLLKREMEALDSLIIQSARSAAVPAGDALAMDRTIFADLVTRAIESRPEIEMVRDEVRRIPPEGFVVLATGPLTSAALDAEIGALLGTEDLYFYDSIAPVVVASSLDFSKMYAMSRYGKGEGGRLLELPDDEGRVRGPSSRISSPARRSRSRISRRHLLRRLSADRGHGGTRARDAAARADEADGPSRPGDREDPARRRSAAPGRPGAGALQPRRLPDETEDPRAAARLRKIPGLENAVFVRFGMLHRNTYIHAPAHLDRFFRMRREPRSRSPVRSPGSRVTSRAPPRVSRSGGRSRRRARGWNRSRSRTRRRSARFRGTAPSANPAEKFEPMNVTFGLIEDTSHPSVRDKQKRRQLMVDRALAAIRDWRDAVESAVPVPG
jgi:methylenetetrahydrofolate--tRNA-(uracil-5-)-methyltransferase